MRKIRGSAVRSTVRQLQSALNQTGQVRLKEDGDLGPRTRGAIRTFQNHNKLKATGRVDRATLETLRRRTSVRNKRQMADTAFQNFDQKANQLINQLAGVAKSMNETRMGAVRRLV